jgi:hypothetical protein
MAIDGITKIINYTLNHVTILEENKMSEEKRFYRKSLSSHGLIYIADEELEITVKNLSITGLLAELDANKVIADVDELFHALELSTTIDLYLPEMRVAGEADVVRAEKVDGHIYFALEFRNLSYDVNNLLYKRKAYRKALIASGEIIFNEETHVFLTQNVSVDGLMIHLKEKVGVKVGYVTTFDFQQLDMKGEVEVIWIEHEDDGSTLMGVQYLFLAQDHIKGIPRFR